MRLVTWNVNSIRRRLEHLERFVKEWQPDVLCLQESKVKDADFPATALVDMGYPHQLIHGQKSYNGVAIISRKPFKNPEKKIWCDNDDCRHASVRLEGIEVHNFYVPAGGDKPDPEKNEKFAHKLAFLSEMQDWARERNIARKKVIIMGDLNVAPLEWDVWNHKRLKRSVGHTPLECEKMLSFWQAGRLLDVPRHFFPEPAPLYSWWGYRYPQAFAKDYGWRLDHMLATPALRGAVKDLQVAKETRSWERPSDHVPLVLDIA
ncbi:MAG: exodeoxyribonuclease III [Pseudomonadota bacterium]